jgi:1-acyl-sn-glycerol-3-phosphate acyltransferase
MRSSLTGCLAALLLLTNVLVWVPLLLLVAVAKLLLPRAQLRQRIDSLLLFIAQSWISCNSLWMGWTQRTAWDVQIDANLHPDRWYLVNCNHQSWVDILVLQHLLNRRIPFLRFFLKQQLIWVPFMGLAWWALDFPFMRRHSPQTLEKHPELRARDQETTRLACEKFSRIPTSVMNFVEGTRFSPAKHAWQQSPYRHLLKPKAGGVAMALSVMGQQFDAILDITIVYPDGIPNFWQFLCGRLPRVVVRGRSLPVPRQLLQGDYHTDPTCRAAYGLWVQQLWQEKDAQISTILALAKARGQTAHKVH